MVYLLEEAANLGFPFDLSTPMLLDLSSTAPNRKSLQHQQTFPLEVIGLELMQQWSKIQHACEGGKKEQQLLNLMDIFTMFIDVQICSD